MQSREGMPLGKARCWASHEARCLAQRRMAVGPSHPQRMPQTAMTVISTKRCLRLRVCRGSESDSKYEPRELTSTRLATGVILGSVDDGFRAPNQGVRQPEDNDRIKDSEPRSVAPDYPDRTAMRAGRGVCTSVNGDNMACVCPLTSTTLMLIVFITPSSNSALGRVVWRPG